MPHKSSEAFVLDVLKLREADRLIVLFTEDEGKIRGVAPSAARSRRRFGGKIERLSRVRVNYFEKEGRDLARIDSCDLLEESFTLHKDLLASAVLAYVAEVADTFTHEKESDRRYFRLLGSTLAAMRGGADPRTLARYFEVWTLRLHGLLPSLDRCEACERDVTRYGAIVAVDATAPAALCSRCAGAAGTAGGGSRVSPRALAALEMFRKHAPTDLARVALPPAVLAEIEGLAVRMLGAFVGRPFRSYRFLREVGSL